MEMMSRPSKEVLVISKNIRKWIIGDKTISGKKQFIFKEDTPQDVLDLFQEIKPKLDFAY